MITKYFHAPWNYQMNLFVSSWFLLVLFSFGMNLWPHVLTKNTGKSFIHMTKNKLFSYEIIRIIQQATSFSFVVLMVRITVIWLSVEYQNFFSFQGVTNAYPPHTVNVPFISSHIRVSRSSLVPNLSTWQFYFPCILFFMFFFFNLKLNSILF